MDTWESFASTSQSLIFSRNFRYFECYFLICSKMAQLCHLWSNLLTNWNNTIQKDSNKLPRDDLYWIECSGFLSNPPLVGSSPSSVQTVCNSCNISPFIKRLLRPPLSNNKNTKILDRVASEEERRKEFMPNVCLLFGHVLRCEEFGHLSYYCLFPVFIHTCCGGTYSTTVREVKETLSLRVVVVSGNRFLTKNESEWNSFNRCVLNLFCHVMLWSQ